MKLTVSLAVYGNQLSRRWTINPNIIIEWWNNLRLNDPHVVLLCLRRALQSLHWLILSSTNCCWSGMKRIHHSLILFILTKSAFVVESFPFVFEARFERRFIKYYFDCVYVFFLWVEENKKRRENVKKALNQAWDGEILKITRNTSRINTKLFWLRLLEMFSSSYESLWVTKNVDDLIETTRGEIKRIIGFCVCWDEDIAEKISWSLRRWRTFEGTAGYLMDLIRVMRNVTNHTQQDISIQFLSTCECSSNVNQYLSEEKQIEFQFRRRRI